MICVVDLSAFGWGLVPERIFIVSFTYFLWCFFGFAVGDSSWAFFCFFRGIEETFYD